MKRKQYLFLILLLSPLFILSPIIVLAASPQSVQNQNPAWEGELSNQKEPFIKIVTTQEEWSQLWARAFDQSAPMVNFKKYVVACIFLGYSADWSYSIDIGKSYRFGDAWIIPYCLVKNKLNLTGPFEASGQYAMRILKKKKDARMVLAEVDQSVMKRW